MLTPLRIVNLTFALLINLEHGKALLLVHDLTLHAVLSLNLEILMAFLLIILRPHYFSLLGFLTLGKEDSLLNLALLLLSLLVNHVVLSRLLPLLLVFQLEVVDFLNKLHTHLSYPLNAILVTVLKSNDFVCTLARVLNLFPGLHLFLLE